MRLQSVEPTYFPPVFMTPDGLMEKRPIYNPEFLQRNPEVRRRACVSLQLPHISLPVAAGGGLVLPPHT